MLPTCGVMLPTYAVMLSRFTFVGQGLSCATGTSIVRGEAMNKTERSFDPQTKAREIMAMLLKKEGGKRTPAYWERVLDLSETISADMARKIDMTPEAKAAGAKRLTSRFRADMMKVSAILEETAAQHIAVLKLTNPPSAVDEIGKEFGKIFDKGGR